MVSIFNFRGYSGRDPLDKAPGAMGTVILILVNLILSVALLYVITGPLNVLYFNGFRLFGISFPSWCTLVLELIINCLIFSPIIAALRKSSSILFYLIVLVPYYILDLYIEAHYRHLTPPGGLWVYCDSSTISFIKSPALKLFFTESVDAIVFGIVGLYIARLLAALIYKNKPYPQAPTEKQYNDLFRKEWSSEDPGKPKRDAAFYILRALGFFYLAYLVILVLGLAGSAPWPKAIADLKNMTYANPALAINTYFKISLMIMLTFTAAYNKKLRFYACAGLLCGHSVSTAYALVFHFYKPLNATDTGFLLTSAITDGLMIAIFIWAMIKYRKDANGYKPESNFPLDFSIPMTLMQNLYRILGFAFALLTLSIVFIRILGHGAGGISAVFGNPDPMIGNTVTLYSTLALICFLLIKRDKLRQHLFNCITVPLIYGSIVAVLWIIIGGLTGGVQIVTRLDPPTYVTVDWYFVLYAVFNVLIVVLLVGFRQMYYRVDYAINTLSPSAAINILAITDAFFGGDSKQQSAILKSIDQYVGGIRGRKRGLMNLPFGLFENLLNFLYGMHPPFSSMARDEQRYFLSKYFLTNDLQRKKAFIPYLADFAYQIGASLNSIVLFANYSYINNRNAIGYVPFDARDRVQGEISAYSPPFKEIAPLPEGPADPNNYKPETPAGAKLVAPRVTTPVKEPDLSGSLVADYVIVGSGAGGATAAYRLAKQLGNSARILVVEAGNRYQPLQDFQDNEIEMMKKVYKEGGLQQTKQFTMNMLQGECVGGSTVINNAVCFKMPDRIHDLWQNQYGIDLSRLEKKYEDIAAELHITCLGHSGINTNVAEKFKAAVKQFNDSSAPADKLDTHYPLHVNHLNNLGDENWNLGNKRMRKRSMLETYIPWSEAAGVEVMPNTTAVCFTTSGNSKKADGILLRTNNGDLTKIQVRKAIIVSGGVVASSQFLMRSGLGKNVGQSVSCNFAFPVAFDFGEQIRAFDGEQMTLGALDPKGRSAFETYFNPPATFALSSVPFYFNRREDIMGRYANLLNFGALIGSESRGTVQKKADLLNGMSFSWSLGKTDIENIKFAVTTLVTLGKYAGSTRAIIPTKPGIDIKLQGNQVEEFIKNFNAFPLRMDDLAVATAHPQGGNLMASSQSAFKDQRVLNEHFQVDGYENVFVADASLFPTSITVNPQWTIMAMSSLAAESVLNICA